MWNALRFIRESEGVPDMFKRVDRHRSTFYERFKPCSNLEQHRYSNYPNLRDEHREFAHEGYIIEDFNPRELGLQTIRIIYKEFSVTIAVEVVNMLDTITCPNEHVYYKNNDGTDPGCPFCHIGNGLSNISYFDITYTSET